MIFIMEDNAKFNKYPEGYEKVKSLLTDIPEDKRDELVKNVIRTIINM